MMSGVHVEVVLAASYAIFLVGVAFILEFLARHSHKRSERYRTLRVRLLPGNGFMGMSRGPAIAAHRNRLPAPNGPLPRFRQKHV